MPGSVKETERRGVRMTERVMQCLAPGTRHPGAEAIGFPESPGSAKVRDWGPQRGSVPQKSPDRRRYARQAAPELPSGQEPFRRRPVLIPSQGPPERLEALSAASPGLKKMRIGSLHRVAEDNNNLRSRTNLPNQSRAVLRRTIKRIDQSGKSGGRVRHRESRKRFPGDGYESRPYFRYLAAGHPPPYKCIQLTTQIWGTGLEAADHLLPGPIFLICAPCLEAQARPRYHSTVRRRPSRK
jgi:hypothetical protein